MTARYSPLFTLRSGQSGLGIYTSGRDAALGFFCSVYMNTLLAQCRSGYFALLQLKLDTQLPFTLLRLQPVVDNNDFFISGLY